MNATHLLISGWSPNPVVILSAAALVVVYLSVFGKSLTARAWRFFAALGVILLALLSPLNTLAEGGCLFSAHMLQHILLLLIAPALFITSLPPALTVPRPLRTLFGPLLGWLAGVGSMWFWHAPALCNAAAASRPVFALQTLSLLILGCAFWWQVIAPQEADRLSPPAAVVYLFTACTACSILGIILTFSPVTVCAAYVHPVDRLGLLKTIREDWGITPSRDQQIGGLLMWVPMCTIYLTAIFFQLARWFRPAPAQTDARP